MLYFLSELISILKSEEPLHRVYWLHPWLRNTSSIWWAAGQFREPPYLNSRTHSLHMSRLV